MTIPANPRAENLVLGAAMVEKNVERVAFHLSLLQDDDFTADHHRVACTAIKAITGRGFPADPFAVLLQLQADGQLSPRLWPHDPKKMLGEMVWSVSGPRDLPNATMRLLEWSLRRVFYGIGTRYVEGAGAMSMDDLVGLNGDMAQELRAGNQRLDELNQRVAAFRRRDEG